MNLAEIDADLRNSLLVREQCVGFSIYQGKAAWLIDWGDHFTLDQPENINDLCVEEHYQRFKSAGPKAQQ